MAQLTRAAADPFLNQSCSWAFPPRSTTERRNRSIVAHSCAVPPPLFPSVLSVPSVLKLLLFFPVFP